MLKLKRESSYKAAEEILAELKDSGVNHNLNKYDLSRAIDDSSLRVFTVEKVEASFLLRLSIVFLIPTYLLLLCFLPIWFVIKGRWNYGSIDWLRAWTYKLGM